MVSDFLFPFICVNRVVNPNKILKEAVLPRRDLNSKDSVFVRLVW